MRGASGYLADSFRLASSSTCAFIALTLRMPCTALLIVTLLVLPHLTKTSFWALVRLDQKDKRVGFGGMLSARGWRAENNST